MRPSVPEVHITDHRDAELAEYRALAGQSVAGLIFGLLAPLALIDPLLWVFPLLGLLFSYWALRRIKNADPALTGRRLATVGLMVSLLFAVAAPAEWLAYHWKIRAEARHISAMWFDCIMQEQPHRAHQLSMAPQLRRPFDDRLWDYYRDNPRQREALKNYTANPAIRAMLALGPRARVRFYDTTAQGRDDTADHVEQLYAITYEEDGERKSFFVAVRMMREKDDDGKAGWRMLSAEGGVVPKRLTKTASARGG